MAHPCPSCAGEVQEGTAFCPHCGAPQIRVANPFDDAPVTPPFEPGTPGQVQPPAEPVQPWARQQQGFRSPTRYNWHAGWRSAITVGVPIGILSAVPSLSMLCCLWMLGGGAMAVVLYRRNSDQPFVPLSIGFRSGALAGAVAFAVTALAALVSVITRGAAAEREAFRQAIQQSVSRGSPDPQTAAAIQRLADWMQSPQGFAIMFTFSLLMVAVAFVLFTGIGGVLGASLFGKRESRR